MEIECPMEFNVVLYSNCSCLIGYCCHPIKVIFNANISAPIGVHMRFSLLLALHKEVLFGDL